MGSSASSQKPDNIQCLSDLTGGTLVPVEGPDSPLFALEINPEKAREEFRSTSQKTGGNGIKDFMDGMGLGMIVEQKNVQELHKASTDEGPKSIKDDAIFHTFGPERRGSVRGLGFGALPSKVDAQVHQNEHVRKLESGYQSLPKKLQSTPHDNLPTSVNEVGSVTESIEAMKLSKRGGSSIANLPTGLDMVLKNVEWPEQFAFKEVDFQCADEPDDSNVLVSLACGSLSDIASSTGWHFSSNPIWFSVSSCESVLF
ncbi:ATPase ARSA1 [Camellia lanceoleosa]|uniref:ATPase ARSA1 n=1 Tax=Camellia lanceoleosa TaxID=1840588 RepID=A0ACC0HHD3_9ERIC|nr:ATPase ARSA1 [Camellia lanceoleosa]